ncbi:hypothetical protein Y1Q_0002639 [Alligator mississippiensis]|uniref:Uncharacterized protein n=1 Tax=Alligator mississippiensis TaxID=8496 RepID=A0A151NYM8_ALLMI|nr:hypothetical protein Y1Q_0002639 [Alligator mississippiensis]
MNNYRQAVAFLKAKPECTTLSCWDWDHLAYTKPKNKGLCDGASQPVGAAQHESSRLKVEYQWRFGAGGSHGPNKIRNFRPDFWISNRAVIRVFQRLVPEPLHCPAVAAQLQQTLATITFVLNYFKS